MMIKMAALPWRWIFCPLMALLRQNYICTIPLCHPMMKKRTPSSEILWGYVHHRNRYREFWGGANILRRSFIVMCICFILTSVLIYHWYRIMEKKVKPMMSWYSISSPNVAPKYGIDLFVCQMNKKNVNLKWCEWVQYPWVLYFSSDIKWNERLQALLTS